MDTSPLLNVELLPTYSDASVLLAAVAQNLPSLLRPVQAHVERREMEAEGALAAGTLRAGADAVVRMLRCDTCLAWSRL